MGNLRGGDPVSLRLSDHIPIDKDRPFHVSNFIYKFSISLGMTWKRNFVRVEYEKRKSTMGDLILPIFFQDST